MNATVEDLVSACFDELRLSQRFVPYVQQAEDAGHPQLAKLFRALVASETVRESLFRESVVRDASKSMDYFVCPFCGLIYDSELPDECPADNTPGAEFIIR